MEIESQKYQFLQSKGYHPKFFHRGGAKCNWLWTIEFKEYFDIVIICIGSNQLGQCTIEQLQDDLNQYSSYLIENQLCTNVVIMGLWPRQGTQFSTRFMLFNRMSRRSMRWSRGVLFWEWSSKLHFDFIDEVHVTKRTYKRSLTYLCSPILYIIRTGM